MFDTAAAVVAGRKITVQEVSAELERFQETEQYKRLAQQGDVGSIRRRYEQATLTELIRAAVLEPKAEELGISVSEGEVQDAIDVIRDDYDSPSAFEEAMKEQNLDLEQLTRILRDNILEDKLREEVTGDITATDAEIEAFYDENIADYTRTKSSHILLKRGDFELAKQLSKQLQNAPKKQLETLFADLARQHSIDAQSGRKGGDLGFTTAGQLVPQYENAAADLDIGEVSDPVQSQFGYHVIMVTGRDITPLANVRDAISQQLGEGQAEKVWQEWLTDAYEDADIRINSRYGELDLESKQVLDATSGDIPGAVETPTPTPTPTG